MRLLLVRVRRHGEEDVEAVLLSLWHDVDLLAVRQLVPPQIPAHNGIHSTQIPGHEAPAALHRTEARQINSHLLGRFHRGKGIVVELCLPVAGLDVTLQDHRALACRLRTIVGKAIILAQRALKLRRQIINGQGPQYLLAVVLHLPNHGEVDGVPIPDLAARRRQVPQHRDRTESRQEGLLLCFGFPAELGQGLQHHPEPGGVL